MARDLLKSPKLGRQPEKSGKGSGRYQPDPQTQSLKPAGSQSQTLTPISAAPVGIANFIKFETNLSGIGFFSPSSKRIKSKDKDHQQKVTKISREIDGERVKFNVTIHAISEFGLPITADQDKYLALMKLIEDTRDQEGMVTNPISFTSAELLRILGRHLDSGKNYKAVSDWLDVMSGTMIVADGLVYAGERLPRKGRFHVFGTAISAGQKLPDGRIADRHYIWFEQWYLHNINHHYQVPIDLITYRRLKTNIAKTLVPFLQKNLYATGHAGVYRKRYAELCRHLKMRQYRTPSEIRRGLGPALNELKKHGYLSEWQLERGQDRREYIVVFFHGEKFRKDRQLQEDRAAGLAPAEGSEVVLSSGPESPPAAADTTIAPGLLAALTSRGIRPKQARQALLGAAPDQDVLGQLEYADHVIAENPDGIKNPPGFRLTLIRENFQVPESFETTAQREERESQIAATAAEKERAAQLSEAYRAYQAAEAEKYIAGLVAGKYARRLAAKQAQIEEEYPKLKRQVDSVLTRLAKFGLTSDIIKELPLLSFSEFCQQQNAGEASDPTPRRR